MSPESIVVYHNPRCSKSRKAVEILESRGVEFTLYHYLEESPGVAELTELMGKLGIDDPRQMMRTKEAEYGERGLADAAAAALLAAMAGCPKLIERPIVIRGDRALIARPPELLGSFLD